MSWGIFEIDGRPPQVAPCDADGFTDHLLYIDCTCGPWMDGHILVHKDTLSTSYCDGLIFNDGYSGWICTCGASGHNTELKIVDGRIVHAN